MTGRAPGMPRVQANIPGDPTVGLYLLVVLGLVASLAAAPVAVPVALLGLLAWALLAFRAGWLAVAGALAAVVAWLVLPDLGHAGIAGALATFHVAQDQAQLADVWPAWVPFGIPYGLLLAGMLSWLRERKVLGQEWSSWEQTRRARKRWTAHRLAMLAARRHRQHPAVLGALVEPTDLDPGRWQRHGRALLPTAATRAQPSLTVAGPGAGKTVALARDAGIDASLERGFVFIDGKATDPELAGTVVATYLDAWTGPEPPRVRIWSAAAPLDIWRARTPAELVGPLLAVVAYSEPYYRDCTKRILQLVAMAPGEPMPTHPGGLVERIDRDWLVEHWRDRPEEAEARSLDDRGLAGARARYASLFATLGQLFDGQHEAAWSWDDVDLAIVQIPTLADPEDGDAAVRLMLASARQWAGTRRRDARPMTFAIDEFSSVPGGVLMALDLAERGRDPGIAVSLTLQSLEGIADERTAARLLGACSGGVRLLRGANPDELIRLAGTRRELVTTWRTGDYGPDVAGLAYQDRPRIDHNAVRAAKPGEAWQLDAGRCGHLLVARSDPSEPAREAAQTILQTAATAAVEDGPLWAYLTRAAETWAPPAPPTRRALPAPVRRSGLVLAGERVPVREWWPLFVLWVRALVARVPRRVRRG